MRVKCHPIYWILRHNGNSYTTRERLHVHGQVLIQMYPTLQAQIDTEAACKSYLATETLPTLKVDKHIAFILHGLEPRPASYVVLDAALPWQYYWCLNALALLPTGREHIHGLSIRLARSLSDCQHPDGGFGGGFGQTAHLATTYAAVLAIAICGTTECYKIINREKLHSWIMSLKQSDGGFAIHRDGEVDARAAYLALSVAALLNILTPEMTHNTASWLSSCQRYEGGLSGVHNAEAHGGLAFCAVAALCILGNPKVMLRENLNLPSLLNWLVSRQMSVEGGFSGRTNKLVDGCYSWWIGGEFDLVEAGLDLKSSLFNKEALTKYLLCCCQNTRRGGLRDKPEKRPDDYHTCYCLAGLSVAQNRARYDESLKPDDFNGWESFCWITEPTTTSGSQVQVGELQPIYVVPVGSAEALRAWSVAQTSVV